jgi:tetratricopeptide (TPR) repeat protein
MKILQAIITVVSVIVIALFTFNKLDTAPYDKKLVIALITAVYGAIIFFLNMKKKPIDWEALAEIRQNDQELIAFQRKTIEELKQQIKRKNQSKWENVVNKLLAKGKLQEAIDSIDTNTKDEEAAQKHIRKAQLLIVANNFPEAEAHYKQAADIFPSPDNNFIVAKFFQDLNRFKEAEDYYTRCLDQVTSPEDRATVLNNLGNVQSNLVDKYVQAEASITEALQIYKELAETNPQTYLPDVAMIYNNLGVLYERNNYYEDAEESYKEALLIYKKLVTTNPQTYQPDIAMIYNNLGVLYERNNYYEDAEESYKEALPIYKKLVTTNPQTYQPKVADILSNLGVLQARTNNYIHDAEAFFTDALQIYEELARKNRQAYLPDVATILNNLGNLYRNTNNYAQAEASYNRALKIRKDLVRTNSQAYLPDVAQTLNNLGNLQADNHDYDQAEKSYKEALQIRRKLAKKNRQAYLLDVAQTLVNLSILYQDGTPNKAKSIQCAKSAIKILKNYNDTPRMQELLGKANDVIDYWKGQN